jgi:hypothetical protein
MIKINLTNEKAILDFHFSNVTKKIAGEKRLIELLNNRIELFKTHPKSNNLGIMYNYLIEHVKKDKFGNSIITMSPEKLNEFKTEFEKKFGDLLDEIFKVVGEKRITFRNDLLNVFFYNKHDKWQAYELAKKIGVQVCPYCNRNYTFIVGSDDNKGTRFQYDHFFDKASFPYLALSFYNLVPSCNACNSDLKGSDKFSITENIHPYLEGFSPSILFSIKAKNIGFVNGQSKSYRIKFKLNPEFKKSEFDKSKIKAAIRNISTFRLSELYNMHLDYVDEIIQKSYIYNKSYISNLYKNHPDLFKSEDDVKRMVLGNYINESDYSKRPLSKLTADIARELKILD